MAIGGGDSPALSLGKRGKAGLSRLAVIILEVPAQYARIEAAINAAQPMFPGSVTFVPERAERALVTTRPLPPSTAAEPRPVPGLLS